MDIKNTSNTFEKLFENFKTSTLELNNRLVMAPMGSALADKGHVSERLIKYYERRAIGGVGLIIVEATYVDTIGGVLDMGLQIHADEYIEGLSKLVKAVKKHGTKIAVQLFHPGGQISSKLSGVQPVAPSAAAKSGKEIPRVLSESEIERIQRSFGEAAARCKQAGFDAVELHGAHGYLIWEFLSPLSNLRNDSYGGDTDGRSRFAVECIRSVRGNVGPDYPLLFRISGTDYLEGGLNVEAVASICKVLEEAGVDVFDISAGTHENFYRIIQPSIFPPGCLVPLSEEIKKSIQVPVIVAGRINSPDLAEEILRKGKADLIAMGRALLADPDLPRKAKEGRTKEIRKCVACNTGFDYQVSGKIQTIMCMQNVETGNEGKFVITKTAERKRVAVVGGGPAGMEASRVLALRGHNVTLYEKGERLGGKVNLIMQVPGKENYDDIVQFYAYQLDKLNVNIILGKEADEDLLSKGTFDTIVIATGSVPIGPSKFGAENKNVAFAEQILSGQAEIGDQVVIIGGGLVGCDTALYLASQGKRVSIVEMEKKVGKEIGRTQRDVMFDSLRNLNVKLLPSAKLNRIEAEGVYVTMSGREQFLEAENIVFAVGYERNNSLSMTELAAVSELYEVGDCKLPRDLLSAFHEGAEVGTMI